MYNKLSFQDYFIIGGLIFSGIVSILFPVLNSVALYIVIPLIFLLSIKYNNGFFFNRYQKYIVLLCLLDLCSGLWANYSIEYNREIKQMLGVFLVTYIFSINVNKIRLIPYLYCTFIALMIGCIVYASNNIVISTDLASGVEQRLHDNILDANTFAYYTFFCSFLLFILDNEVYSKRGKVFFRFLFILMIPFSFIIALLTASRQILIIQIPLLIMLLYVRYLHKQNSTKKFLFLIILILFFVYIIPTVFDLYSHSYLGQRADIDIKDDSRYLLLIDAINVGWEHFPFGVGAGNYIAYSFNNHFSHSTYTELWANLGICGLLIFLKLIFVYINTQWKRFKKYKDKNYLSFLIFGLIFAFHNIFYVFYTGLWLMGFFVLVASHSEIYFRRQRY